MKNHKVIILSLIALLFMYLTFAVRWTFIIGAAVLSWLSWKILTKDLNIKNN